MNDLITFITVNNHPRVLDVSLATELVVARLSDIRAIINEYKYELEQMGELYMAGETHMRGGRTCRQTHRYFLNEEQALFVGDVAKPKPEECVHTAITKCFDAFRRDQIGTK
jgi:hypothetical protein